jgi:TonB family protein
MISRPEGPLRDRSAGRTLRRWSSWPATISLSLLASLAPWPRLARAVEPPAGTVGDAASLAAAKQLLGEKKFRAAAKAYAEANEHAGGHCGECLLGLARAKLGLGDLDAGIAATQDAVGALAGDPLQGLAVTSTCNGPARASRRRAAPPPIAALTAAGEAYKKALASRTADRNLALTGLATSRFRVVILEAIIDEQGCVTNVHVLKGLPAGLDRAAVQAAMNWVFEPARLEGRPVRVYYSLTVTFDVNFGSIPPP